MTTRKLLLATLVLFVLLVATGCADANLAQDNAAFCGRELTGFWWGLVHGFISPVTFVISLFNPDVAVYDICNVGGWYDFGFLLGVGAFSSGSHTAATSTTGGSGGQKGE